MEVIRLKDILTKYKKESTFVHIAQKNSKRRNMYAHTAFLNSRKKIRLKKYHLFIQVAGIFIQDIRFLE